MVGSCCRHSCFSGSPREIPPASSPPPSVAMRARPPRELKPERGAGRQVASYGSAIPIGVSRRAPRRASLLRARTRARAAAAGGGYEYKMYSRGQVLTRDFNALRSLIVQVTADRDIFQVWSLAPVARRTYTPGYY